MMAQHLNDDCNKVKGKVEHKDIQKWKAALMWSGSITFLGHAFREVFQLLYRSLGTELEKKEERKIFDKFTEYVKERRDLLLVMIGHYFF